MGLTGVRIAFLATDMEAVQSQDIPVAAPTFRTSCEDTPTVAYKYGITGTLRYASSFQPDST
jgi:hypothetical protein